MKIYKHKTVAELEKFYGDLLTNVGHYKSVRDHLRVLASRMWEGVRDQKDAVLNEISNYHWQHLGKSKAALIAEDLSEDDCRQAIANEFGFRRWTEVEHMGSPYNLPFEKAINTMLAGDLTQLKKDVSQDPKLLNYKSSYGHKATLLHYAASNGVELWRQKVPLNLPDIVSYLIEAGANTRAKMKVYGGEYTAAELVPSSAHPINAGIITELRSQFDS
ncbi:MAG: hypothetical protein AB3N14_08665 [Flavobacteriaceae bacterium]